MLQCTCDDNVRGLGNSFWRRFDLLKYVLEGMTLCQLDISYMTVFFSWFIAGILIFILTWDQRETRNWIQFTDKKIDEMYYAYSGYLLWLSKSDPISVDKTGVQFTVDTWIVSGNPLN